MFKAFGSKIDRENEMFPVPYGGGKDKTPNTQKMSNKENSIITEHLTKRDIIWLSLFAVVASIMVILCIFRTTVKNTIDGVNGVNYVNSKTQTLSSIKPLQVMYATRYYLQSPMSVKKVTVLGNDTVTKVLLVSIDYPSNSTIEQYKYTDPELCFYYDLNNPDNQK